MTEGAGSPGRFFTGTPSTWEKIVTYPIWVWSPKNKDMDIVSRLKIFLKENGISNSLFADNCGIPRPTLSQLLNGRNKKVSDELITKIHSAYPALNVMWLMFGDGEMFVPNANTSSIDHQSQPAEKALDFTDAGTAGASGRATTISFGSSPERSDYRDRRTTPPQVHTATMAETIRSMASSGAKTPPRAGVSSKESRVVSIMVFYSDGRFETFVPQE